MDIDEAVLEVQQSRSAYQIARFVLGQHDTPEMRFYQLCLELGSIRHKLRLTENNIKQMKIKTQRLLDKGDELSLLKAEEAEINLEQVLKAQKGAENTQLWKICLIIVFILPVMRLNTLNLITGRSV